MTDLAFPEITPPPARQDVPPLPVANVKSAVLALFADAEAEVLPLVERYRGVAYDVATPKGMKAAKDARQDLREKGRYAIQRAARRAKDDLNDAKKAVDAEEERLVALIRPVEDHVHQQITAHEERLAREKAEREEAERRAREAAEAAEAERKARHRQTIATLAGYVVKAAGKPAEQIARGIAYLENLPIPDGSLEEFTAEAQRVKGETLAALKAMHAKAVEAEAAAEEMARLRAELDARRAAEAEEQRRLQEAMEAAAFEAQKSAAIAECIAGADAAAQAWQQGENQIVPAIPEPVALGTIPATTIEPVKLDLPPARPGPVVMIDRATPRAEAKPTLKLGDINGRIAPLKIDADGLAALGFPMAAKERGACLYFASDLPKMVAAMRLHLEGVA